MSEGETRYAVKAALNMLRVVEFLSQDKIHKWKSIREVAAGTDLKINLAYRLLDTAVAAEWAEKGPKGYRLNALHLTGLLIHAQDYYKQKLRQLGAEI